MYTMSALCRRLSEIQNVNTLGPRYRGINTVIGPANLIYCLKRSVSNVDSVPPSARRSYHRER